MVTVPVKIYSAKDSSRLRYIAGIILGDILGLQWDFTTDKRKLVNILLLIIPMRICLAHLRSVLIQFCLKRELPKRRL